MSPPEPTPQKSPSLIQIEFPKEITPFVWLAMAAGLILIIVGVLGSKISIAGGAANVLIGAGIAIILAAFGGQATVTGKAFVFAGVAAIAAAIIWFLFYQQTKFDEAYANRQKLLEKQYVIGTLHGLPKSGHPRLRFTNYVLGSEVLDTRDFAFIIFQSNTKEAKYAVLGLDDSNNPESTIEISIPKSCLLRSLGASEALDWQYKQLDDEYQIIEREEDNQDGLVIGRQGKNKALPPLPQTICPTVASQLSPRARAPLDLAWLFATPALAQGADGQPAALTQAKLDALIEDMQSDDTNVRRSARDALSNAGPADVRIIMDALSKGKDVSRIKVGIAVALTGMLRRDKSQNEAIWPILTDNDRNLLLDLAGDPDRNVSIYATEFLFDLGDAGVTKMGLARAASSTNETARYNWIFAGLDGWRHLTEGERTELGSVIATIKKSPGIGSSTVKLFDKLPR